MGVEPPDMLEHLRRPVNSRAALLRRGFTLLEVMLVMAIAAVIAAIAVPRYGVALARYRADAAARRVAADLAFAQSTARATSQSVTMTFDAAAETYTIVGLSDPDHLAAGYVVDLTQRPYTAVVSSVNFGGGAGVTFNGYGVPATGGDVVVASGKWTRTVHVDGTTGKATVQ